MNPTISVLMPIIDAVVKVLGVVILGWFAQMQRGPAKAKKVAALIGTLDKHAEAAVALAHRMTGYERPMSIAGPELARIHAAQDQLALEKLRVTGGPTMEHLRHAGERADAIASHLIAKHAAAHHARSVASRGSLIPTPAPDAPAGV